MYKSSSLRLYNFVRQVGNGKREQCQVFYETIWSKMKVTKMYLVPQFIYIYLSSDNSDKTSWQLEIEKKISPHEILTFLTLFLPFFFHYSVSFALTHPAQIWCNLIITCDNIYTKKPLYFREDENVKPPKMVLEGAKLS